MFFGKDFVQNILLRAGARAVDLGGPSVYQRGQCLKLSTKAIAFKKLSLLIRGAKHVQAPLTPLGTGPGFICAPSVFILLCGYQTRVRPLH